MKINKIMIISLILIVGLTFIGAISAQDADDLVLTNNIDGIDDVNIAASEDGADLISDDSCCDDNGGDSQPVVVRPDPENPNQVQKPTVQPVIDNAKEGDTIILDGTFVHCHFMINKTLTILATPGTSVGVCPHHTHMMKYGEGPEDNGIFYISPQANGTVISGFSFTNDFYHIANNVYNPFGIYSEADDVILENLTFNWTGTPQQTSSYDPDDFLFNAIILNSTNNTTIRNIVVGNVNSLLNSVNASNIKTSNITSVKEEVRQPVASSILLSNLNILSGDSGILQIALKDSDNNPLSNRTITLVIDGDSKSLTTNGDGIAKISVKYASSGNHYVTAFFAGDEDYKASANSCKIIVAKKATALTAPKAVLKIKKAKKISIKLTSNGKAVSGKKITIKVNGRKYVAKTNKKGVATVKLKLSKKKTYKVIARFAGDKYYKASKKKSKVVIK